MESVKRQWSFVIAFIITAIFTVGAQDTCPDLSDEVAASDQRCTENRRCETVAQCKGNRQCVCDGPCGLRCIKTLKQDYCEEILDEPEDGQLEFDPPNTRAFNTTAIYTCNSGSILLYGDLRRVCRGDRTWSGEKPKCVDQGKVSCDLPPLPDHVVITTEGYSPNDRVPHYTYVSFGCEAGYQEERQVQVREILCYQGRWLNGDVTRMECLPIPCRDPTAIEHGTYELIEENGFHENALVLYTCDNGYTTDDVALSRCQNGQWTPSSPPTCEVDQDFVDVPDGEACPIQVLSVGRIFHGNREVYPPGVTSIAHNEVAHVACSATDRFDSTCINGEWSIPLTSCNRQEPCLPLSDEAENSNIKYDPTFFLGQPSCSSGTIATHSCNEGFQGNPVTKTCRQGDWSNGDVPVCEPAPCSKFEDFQGSVTYNPQSNDTQVPHDTNAVFSRCGWGFRLNQNNTQMTCRHGEWRGEKACRPETCESDVVNHASIVYREGGEIIEVNQPYHGVERRFTCDDGYTLLGNSSSACLAGIWNNVPPVCRENSCTPITQGNHVTEIEYDRAQTGNFYSVGTRATITCDENSYLMDQGDGISQCSAGAWQPSIPVCKSGTCPRPPVSSDLKQFINNTVEITEHPGEEFPLGTYIISRCHDPGRVKLVPARSVRRECTIMGWTNPQPRCDPVEAQILINGQNVRQLRNDGTLVIQSNYGKLYIFCQVKTRWSYPHFSAPHITRVQQITASKQGYKIKKYHLGPPQVQDSGIFTCTYNGKSISLHIQIRDVRCGDPGIPDYGFRSGNDFHLTREVTFSCPATYTLQGPSAITCNLGGWSGETPTCRRNECPEYDIPPNVREVAGSGFHHGAIRIFQCLEGFITDNGETQVTTTCENDGQWLHDPPQCKAVQVATSGPDPCDTTKCEAWEVCAVVNNEGQCFCARPSDCPLAGSPNDTVCGSDRREYDTYCHLRATACFFTRTITVYKSGPCPDEPTEYSDEVIQEYSLYSSSDYSESQDVIPATNDSVGQDVINATHNPGTGRK